MRGSSARAAKGFPRPQATRYFLTPEAQGRHRQRRPTPIRHYLRRYMTFVTVEPPPHFRENHCRADCALPESVCSTVKL